MIVTEEKIKSREALFTELYYSVFPSVASFIKKSGGTLEDAKDLFHDAIINYYEKEKLGTLSVTTSKEAYIFGTVRFMWNHQFNERSRQNFLNGKELEIPSEDKVEASSAKLLSLLERTGKKCLELLQSFYYEKIATEEFADRFGFKSIRSATVQKFKCLEKVRDQVKNKDLKYEDFLD